MAQQNAAQTGDKFADARDAVAGAETQDKQKLINVRRYIKGRISLVENELGDISTVTSIAALAVAADRLSGLFTRLEDVNLNLEIMDPAQLDEGLKIERKYQRLLTQIRERREVLKQPCSTSVLNESGTAPEQQRKPNLPKISLPKFSRSYGDWLSFKDLYVTMVHENEDLSPVQKFYYLKSCLVGEASSLVTTLECTNENYLKAWTAITSRYDNKVLIANYYLQHILSLNKVNGKSYTLRKLLNDFMQYYNSLLSLNISNLEDFMLIHILSTKIDYSSLRDFELQRNSSEFSSLQQFLTFVQQRCQALDMLCREEAAGISKVMPVLKSPAHMTVGSNNNANGKSICCLYCNKNHSILKCFKFIKLTPNDRQTFVKNANLCVVCLSNKHCSSNCTRDIVCKKCSQKHHNLLHLESQACNMNKGNNPIINETQSDPPMNIVMTSSIIAQDSNASVCLVSLLPTALVYVCDNEGKRYDCRVLLDIGSQKDYISSAFANKLGCVQFEDADLTVAGVGGHTYKLKHKVALSVYSNYSDFKFCSEFGVLDFITDPLPAVNVSREALPSLMHLHLADPNFNVSKEIDMILGVSCFAKCLREGKLDLGPNMPTLINTAFGWICCGDLSVVGQHVTKLTSPCCLSVLHNDIKKFWQLEETPNDNILSFQEKMCEDSYLNSVSRGEDGRYYVDLPVNNELLPKLGNSYNVAFHCLMSLEKKFQNNSDFFVKYKAFIDEFIKLGHAHFVDINPHKTKEIEYYMPHHAVIKDGSSTTKLRIVFNGSQPTSSGLSLNDILLVGPVVQPDMFTILLRFRTYTYVFVSDITKMYRQIQVKPEFQTLQRILWRDDPSHSVRCLQLNTVTYGTASASFLATRTLVKLVEDEGEKFPSASKALLNSTFVDDILHGENDLPSALNTMNELQVLLGKGKFELHKWYSNSSELMSHIPPDKHEKCQFSFNNKEDSCIKTLGLKWEPPSDKFQVEVPTYITSTNYTKRSILSDIAKVYDPLGFIAPVTVYAKLIMQDIWKANIDWDSKVPDAILIKWKSFCANLKCLNVISVPRLMLDPNAVKIELHGFADSSTKAYGCVVFIRCSRPEKTTVHLVCAKTRVAPLKPVTLPRLELCAALLLTKLMSTVSKTLNVRSESLIYWTDSMITLCWIKNDPAKRDVFVSNRVAQIQSLSNKDNWFHVSSSENPADVASRGLEPQNLPNCKLWFAGPHWLSQPDSPWLHSPQTAPSDESVGTEVCNAVPSVLLLAQEDKRKNFLNIFEKFSSWSRLVRVIAYVRRFISNIKNAKSKFTGFLTGIELNQASISIIKCVQHAHFQNNADGCVSSKLGGGSKSSKYLNIFSDGEKMLRVGGRLRHADIPVAQKFPLLVPARCHVTDLLIRYEHERLLHAGTQTTLSSLRGFVWPLDARNRVRHLIHKCVRCYRFKAEAASQIMADLPKYRVTPSRPFLFTGIDFAGPLSTKVARIRKPIITKGYICLFVCLSTKAIHIELVSNLTTKEFLNALRRFISRRGKCAKIFRDNGTTFHGAKNELHELYKMFKNDFKQISNYIASENIEWRFIIPHSAHWGGLWESSVKLVKHHLKRVLGNTVLCYEHLYTLLAQIEAIVNSRPITPLRDLDCDEQCLTPAHFLIGSSLTSFPEGDFTKFPDNRLDIYHQLCKLRQTFWKRWKADYLNTLQMRYKWYKENPDLMLNTIVLIKDDNQPPLSWPLGRVVELYKGKDNHIRAVVVKTKTGLYSRPITKVVPLPFEQN